MFSDCCFNGTGDERGLCQVNVWPSSSQVACHVAFRSVKETCPILTCTDNICVSKTQDLKDQNSVTLLQAASAVFKNICCSIEEMAVYNCGNYQTQKFVSLSFKFKF